MSRTYKKYYGGYFRNAKGRKQALANGARPKSVPPDSYDDIDYDNQCFLPFKIAKKLYYKKHMQPSDIIDKLMKKYGLTYEIACECLPHEALYDESGCQKKI